jgi:hypothetical protein
VVVTAGRPQGFKDADLAAALAELPKWRVPSVSDPYWTRLVEPMLLLIGQSPRSIVEIIAWGKQAGVVPMMTKNMLAYLSFHGSVEYDEIFRRWRVAL